MAIINGNNSANTLTGTSSADTIYANDGNDTIRGGAGNDVLFGGLGSDKFVFESTVGANGVDTIKDYVYSSSKGAQQDVLDLTRLIGSLSKVNIANYARLVIDYSRNKIVLEVDKDGATGKLAFGTVAVLDNLLGGETVRIQAGTSFFDLRAPSLSRPVTTPIDTDGDATNNTVQENATVGTTVGITANATDPDLETVTYSLVGNAQGTTPYDGEFTVNTITGVVSVVDPMIDYESGATRTIYVKASSSDGSSAVGTFTIAVTNVNEGPSLTGTASTLTAGTEDIAYTVTKAQLLAGWTDPDTGTTLDILGLVTADFGTVVDNGNDTYTITAPNYNGTMTLTYTVTDGATPTPLTAPAELTYVLSAVADNPLITSQPVFDNEKVTLSANDPDSSSALTLVVNNSGTYTTLKLSSADNATITDDAVTPEEVTLGALTTAATGVLAVKSAGGGYANTNASIGVGTSGGETLDLSLAAARSAIFAYGGNDSLKGSIYADTLALGEGADTAEGGAGFDTHYVAEIGSGVDTIVINAVVGTSSDSAAQRVNGTNGDDTGGDTISGFKMTEDVLLIKATNVNDFNHADDAVIGTPGAKDDGKIESFLANVGLVDLNGNLSFIDSGDIAINFASTSGTWNVANFKAALKYDLTGTSGTDGIYGGSLADTITGLGGADVIEGMGGADTIYLGASDNAADVVKFNAATEFGDTVYQFEAGSGSDLVRLDKSLSSANNTTYNSATASQASGVITKASATIKTTDLVLVSATVNDASANELLAANLSNLGSVATLLGDCVTITDAGGAAEKMWFVVEAKDSNTSNAVFALYSWTQGSDADTTINSGELSLIGMFYGSGAVATTDFIIV